MGCPELLWTPSQARPVSQAAEPGLRPKGRGWSDHPGLAWPRGQSVNSRAFTTRWLHALDSVSLVLRFLAFHRGR